MAQYDFKNLSPYDFEVLVHGLMEAELDMRLERFSPGRDKGIDLRCLTTGGAVGALRPRGLGEVENEYGFAAAPQLTMSAGADAINVLRRSRHVRAAVEDKPRPLGL